MKLRTIDNIKFYKYEAEVILNDNTELVFEWDGKYDIFEEDVLDWASDKYISKSSLDIYMSQFIRNFSVE